LLTANSPIAISVIGARWLKRCYRLELESKSTSWSNTRPEQIQIALAHGLASNNARHPDGFALSSHGCGGGFVAVR
jgi:hypothetical protein